MLRLVRICVTTLLVLQSNGADCFIGGTQSGSIQMNTNIPDVGSQDPELNNSPVASEGDEDTEVLRQEIPPEPACFFNGTAYPDNTVVKSGAELLRCDKGLWVSAGPSDSTNP